MDFRRLFYSSAVYGAADVVVLAVGGFFLLPLYTRTLSQAQFGTYVIVKTNAELFTYLLYFGLPSAVARVYFDHRRTGTQIEYMSSILSFFTLNLLAFVLVCLLCGGWIWSLLSPKVPSLPNLWYSVAIASVGFFATLGPLWLRLEDRVHALVAAQVGTAAVLVVVAVVNLLLLHQGLGGLVLALLISSAVSAALLPWLFGGSFRPMIHPSHIRESLHFAAPTALGYVAFFVLNRIGTLILQHHVDVGQIAIFGVSQQLAMLVTIIASSFGKAMQPAVYGGEPFEAREVLQRSGRMLLLVMFGITSAVMLFGPELLALIAPTNFAAAYELLVVLAWANFAYSFNLIFSTALIYERLPKTSVMVSIAGAAASVILGLWLIPLMHLRGAALANAGAFLAMILCGHWAASRFIGHSLLVPMVVALGAAGLVGALATWIERQGFLPAAAVAIRTGIAALVVMAVWGLGRMSFRGEATCRG